MTKGGTIAGWAAAVFFAAAVFAVFAVFAGGARAQQLPREELLLNDAEEAAVERLFEEFHKGEAPPPQARLLSPEEETPPPPAAEEMPAEMRSLARINAAVKKRLITEVAAILEREGMPQFGESGVTVYEFSDYKCGYCRHVFSYLDAAVRRGEIQIKVVELPVLGPASEQMARGALAAWRQGKYADFHRLFMSAPANLSQGDVVRLAGEAGMDEEALIADADSEETGAVLRRNFQAARLLGVYGTPAFIIGDRYIGGAMSEEDFLRIIREGRQTANSPQN